MKLFFFIFLLAFNICHKALASTATGNLCITATVLPMCRISPPILNFPSVSSSQTSSTIIGSCSFDIRATNGLDINIHLTKGANVAPNIKSTRVMKCGSNFIEYELYSDVACTRVWNESNGIMYSSKSAEPYSIMIYGKAFIDQNTVSGMYSDEVVVLPDCSETPLLPTVLQVNFNYLKPKP